MNVTSTSSAQKNMRFGGKSRKLLKGAGKARFARSSFLSVENLGSFYVEYRHELYSHALRVLKDSAKAEEVIQEALIKVMLGAPELSSKEHALAYLHRTIENLCIDIFRHEGRRPNLVLLDDVSAEIDTSWTQSDDFVEDLTRVEDAAIVRQALALLSPAERAALIMWEVEGRSSSEIAVELGVNPRTVRHTVSRARSSLRRVLSELVLDEVSGFTALDLLALPYRKASQMAKNTGKISLSLILVLFAFLGFNSLQPDLGISNLTDQEITKDVGAIPPFSIEPQASNLEPSTPVNNVDSGERKVSEEKIEAALSFPGLNKAGVPIGFTAADSAGGSGIVYFRERPAISTDLSLASGQVLKTQSGAANVLISQTLDFEGNKARYNPIVSFGRAGTWVPLEVKVTSTSLSPQTNGNYLLTAYIAVESELETALSIKSAANGRDLAEAPKRLITRLVLDSNRTQVLAQAVYVIEKGASA